MDIVGFIVCIIVGICILVFSGFYLYELLVGFDKPKVEKKRVCLDCCYRDICKYFEYKRSKPCRFVKSVRKNLKRYFKHSRKFWL